MQVDITLLGHFLSAHDHSDVKAADEWVGVYRACQLFAFLPYQLLLSVTQVLFPMLARAKAEGDLQGVRRYVERGARLAAIACGMMVSVIVAMPRLLLSFAYSSDVALRGEGALRILALGQGGYDAGDRHDRAREPRARAPVGRDYSRGSRCGHGRVLPLTGSAAFGGSQLRATAVGTSIALLAALVVAGVYVRREAGGFVPGRSALRVLLALAVAGSAGSFLPMDHGRMLTPVLACVVAATFVLVLVVTRELTRADVTAVRMIRRA